jgi:PAS domain S-box-containing protein
MHGLPDWWFEADFGDVARDPDELQAHLAQRQRELQHLVEMTSGTVLRLAADGRIEFVDASVTSLLGFERAALVGKQFGSVVADSETVGTILGDESPVGLIESLAETDAESTITLPLEMADGQTVPIQLSATELAEQDAYLCVLEEPDEQPDLTENSIQSTDIVDAVGDPLYVLDTDGAIVRVNDAMVAYTGYDRDELVGRAIGEIIPAPEYTRATQRLASLAAGKADTSDTFETTLVTKDGELIHSEAKVTVLTDVDGEYVGSVGVLRDIRGRKQRERDLELLKQVLTRVFRHNVRNELTVIQTNAELLEHRVDADTDEYTEAILDTCQRLLGHSEKARLMEQVLDTDGREEIDIARTVVDLAESARESAPAATIEVDVTEPTYVEAHPDIGNAIEELIENAVQHAPEGEEPTVRIWTDETDSFRTLFIEDESGGLADNEIDVLRVGEESDLEHGSGVGLWLVRWLVNHSKAKMVAHRTDEGSLMGVRFPRHDDGEEGSVRTDADTPFTRAPAHVRELSPERFHGETVVGRMEELHRLEDTYDAVRRTGGHAVLVTGETGVGKSTLVTQFQRRLAESDAPPLLATGYCESTMTRPYHALQQALGDLPVETELAETLAGVRSSTADDPGTAKQRKQALFADVAETLRDLAMDHPVVLVVEDLQWADPGTVDLLRYLIDEVGQWALPILFVGTYRSEEIDDAHPIVEIADQTVEAGRGTVLELDAFSPTDVRNLLTYMLDVENVPESFVETVQDHTGGTPLFVAEVGRQLAETIGSATDSTELPEDLDAVSLPDSVANAVTDRIDALSEPVQEVLELGAVIGDAVSFDVLRDATDRTETALVECVDRLVQKHIWTRTSGQLTFVHGIVREIVLDQIEDERRRQHHRRVARAIERVHADGLEAWYGRLATHYDEAGESALAIEYYSKAGGRAGDAYAHQDAIESYERALVLADDSTTTPDTLAELHADLADVFRAVGDLDSARDTAGDAVSVAPEESPQLCRSLGILAAVQTAQGDFEQGSKTTARQRDLAARLGATTLEAEAVRRLGVIAKNQASFDRASEYYQTALALAEAETDREFVATVQKELGIVAWRQGEYDTAHECFEESLAIAQGLNARSLEAACLNNLGGLVSQEGAYDQAREYHEQSLAIKREIGDRKGESYSLNNIGEILTWQGDYEQAQSYYEQSLAIKREIGDSRGQSETLRNLGITARLQGEYERAQAHLEEGLSIARDIGERLREAGNLHGLGTVACTRGAYDQAREYFQEALSIAREMESPVEQIDSLRGLGVVAREQGADDQAHEYFEAALDTGSETAFPAEVARTHLSAARLALVTDDHDTARERVDTACDIFEELGGTLWSGRCRAVRGRLAASEGANAAAVEHWEAALDTFEEIGAPHDALATLLLLIEHHREQDRDERARTVCRRARQRLATVPDPVVEQYEQSVERHAAALGLS